MNVWIINLKDNRDDKPDGLEKTKFDYCKDNNIIGIGWATEESKLADSTAFIAANNAMDSFEIGDLVWVKDPYTEDETKKYYLCKITGKSQVSNDEEMNKNDIGKYCTCKFYPVPDVPDDFSEERLIAVHTIERANEPLQEKTGILFDSFDNKKKKCKKIGIVAIICAVAVVFSVLIGTKIASAVNKKTHPILPNGLEFGMSIDAPYLNQSTAKNDDALEKCYEPLSRDYSVFLHADGTKSFFDNYPLKIDLEIRISSLKLNENKQFYQVILFPICDEGTNTSNYFDELCNYYEKAFGNVRFENGEDGRKTAVFSKDDIVCTIDDVMLMITITSDTYSPKITEISKEAIGNALDSLKYNVSGFTMKLATLLNECVSDMNIKYCSVYDAVYDLGSIKATDDIVNKLKNDYSEYAATSYLITVHGDVCQNPDLPYLKTEDVDVIKLVLIFDDYGTLIDDIVLDECKELNTYAILTMFG